MGEVKWTIEQEQAIEESGVNTLVAAAAGSGKTAVLVERIIQKIVKQNIDVDKLLVVTFTNAAASEIRQRVLEAIDKRLENDPHNENLQKQLILLNRANISTIDAFCLNVIKNNFFEIGISPNFRIGDNAEIELLKLEVMDELFEELYEQKDEDFLRLTEIYTTYRGDEPLKELVSDIYRNIQSSPFPMDWLEEQVEKFNLQEKLEQDFSKTQWGKILLQEFSENIQKSIQEIEVLKRQLNMYPELEKYVQVLCNDQEKLEAVLKNANSWDEAYTISNTIEFAKWPVDRKIVSDYKDIARDKRKEIRDNFNKFRDSILLYDSLTANKDINDMYPILKKLQTLIIKFEQKYNETKQTKNLLDFNDIEHLALKVLLKKDKDGKYIPSEIAKQYQKKFEEIAIDEYQDSNLVQEYILTTISNGNNLFMVGDVKQSIYKFRQARPELFLEKYKKYKLKKDKKQEDSLKIQLFANFRSRENVLEFANIVFENIMSYKLGDIDYNKEEYLNYSANYELPIQKVDYAGKIELAIIDNGEEEDFEESEEEEREEKIENVELEARFVANKIKELLESNYHVWDKKQGYRKVTYKDIVVLLRATTESAPIYEKAILDLGLPVFSDSSTTYLESTEIETMMSLLKIIDNPMQDIPLVTILRSMIGGFTENELIEIRLTDKNCSFYESLLKANTTVSKKLQEKIDEFINKLTTWQELQENLPLDELIWRIYLDTGYYNYVTLMPNGILRQANLKMLFERAKQYEDASFKGLFNFIRFMDRLKKNNGDLGAAKLIGENENVIRIMSIHKSKGLEFPVVFLAGTGKQFNLRDLNKNILFHQDLGLGPKYINYERKIEYNTLAKEATKIQLKRDSLSEEMRVLYVALTRSREKLIITGVTKEAEKSFAKKQSLLEVSKQKDKIGSLILQKYKTYLDWIELVYIKNQENLNNVLEKKVYKASKLHLDSKKEEVVEEDIMEKLNIQEDFKQEEYEKVDRELSWTYKNEIATKVPSKLSVSAIKQIKNEKLGQKQEYTQLKLEKPKFLLEKNKLTKAEIGTATHYLLQKLDLRKDYTKEQIQKLAQSLVLKEMLTQIEADSINIDEIYKFTKSEFANRIRNSKNIFQEMPFYTYLEVNEIYGDNSNENILVQGIIDMYFEEDDGMVLVDYKTDYVTEAKQLIQKHEEQLEMYKIALERATGKKVKEIYLYSTCLNEAINVDF